MKIFDWVHRKFHHQNELFSTLVKDELSGDQTTILKVGLDHKQASVQQGTLADMLGGWNDGILTIGTLGFDEPLNSFHFNYNEIENDLDDEHEKQDHVKGEGDETEHDNEGEKDPLVLKAIRDSFKDGQNNIEVLDYERLEKNNIGERTTLADLFYADYDGGVKRKVNVSPSEELFKSKTIGDICAGTKQSTNKKNRAPFAKKLIPLVGDDSSRPIKRINQLMTKMLKRKIHPELGEKAPKSEGHKGNQNMCGIGANEKHSLLQTQAIVL